MIKQIELSGKTCLLVEVPDGNCEFMISASHDFVWYIKGFMSGYDNLPPGNWRILGSGKASEITEDEWKEIVERVDDGKWFKDYTGTQDLWFTAAESGLSLLSQNNFRKESTVILVKE